MATLFVSDLHLSPARPAKVALFQQFLAVAATRGDTLYILGDLVDAWFGDDDPSPGARQLVALLQAFAASGSGLHVMHGNHDFLMSETFSRETGASLLDEVTSVTLHGERVVLTHGDLLCTNDHAYQELRAMVRDPQWQANALAKSMEERLALAADIRATSVAESTQKDPTVMDVAQDAVEAMLRDQDACTMIHGHTHRPALHEFDMDGAPCRRYVLPDWYQDDGVLVWDTAGPRTLPVSAYLAD